MQLEILPARGDNYSYLVICEQTGAAAVVDPVDPSAILQAVRQLGCELTAIWNTHHHSDHTSGNAELCRGRQLAVLGHRLDGKRIPGLTRALEHGETVTLGQLQARILHTPGHTRGSVCYQVRDALFTGDTLFVAGCGRLFEGQAPDLYRSLNEILRALPAELRIFSGHEYARKNLRFARGVDPENPSRDSFARRAGEQRAAGQPVGSTLAEQLEINPFLRCEQAAIAQGLGLQPPADPREVFAHLRQLRDRF